MNKSYLEQLDVYRALAALSVCAVHFSYNSVFHIYFKQALFVQFFFTLSGFVIYLNKNYKFESNPILLNNTISPMADWFYFDFKKEQNQSELILLNYEETQVIKTELNNSNFIAQKLPPLLSEIKGINIFLKAELEKDKTFEVILYKVQNKKKEKLISNQVLFKKSLNNKFIDLSLKDPEGRKLRSYVIEIKPFKKGVIRNVDLIINNKIKLNDYQIIEKKQNCYFLKKND